MKRKEPRCCITLRAVGIALAAIAIAGCSTPSTPASSVATVPSHHETSTTLVPPGVLQLRPVIVPHGVAMPACPAGEELGTCSARIDFSTLRIPLAHCRRTTPATNPPPDLPVTMIEAHSDVVACFSLAPASDVITAASSVNTDIAPLRDQPGIEVVLRPSDVAAYDAAMGKSFKQPLAVVADGQIVYIVVPEPNQAQYLPMGGVLIFYGSNSEIQRIAVELGS